MAAGVVLVLAGCSSGPPTPSADPTSPAGHHHHRAGGAAISLPVGDGTTAHEVGYTLADVRLPATAGEPGTVSFVIESSEGRPQRGFLVEQTKRMHVYVVRQDLSVFRHLHPRLRRDGTWSGTVTLPEPGDYRVIAEFVARDEGGNGDHILLGARAGVGGSGGSAEPVPATAETADWGVAVEVLDDVTAGRVQTLRMRLTAPGGGLLRLGDYLGVPAHLTGFHAETGAVAHLHPSGPAVADGASPTLAFEAELPEPGRYVAFLQVRVDGFLHTLPLAVEAR